MRIVISFSDGVYSYRPAKPDGPGVEVPETTLQLWDVSQSLYLAIQAQMSRFDNEQFEKEQTILPDGAECPGCGSVYHHMLGCRAK